MHQLLFKLPNESQRSTLKNPTRGSEVRRTTTFRVQCYCSLSCWKENSGREKNILSSCKTSIPFSNIDSTQMRGKGIVFVESLKSFSSNSSFCDQALYKQVNMKKNKRCKVRKFAPMTRFIKQYRTNSTTVQTCTTLNKVPEMNRNYQDGAPFGSDSSGSLINLAYDSFTHSPPLSGSISAL